jgi:hypothetical protein
MCISLCSLEATFTQVLIEKGPPPLRTKEKELLREKEVRIKVISKVKSGD